MLKLLQVLNTIPPTLMSMTPCYVRYGAIVWRAEDVVKRSIHTVGIDDDFCTRQCA